MGRDDYINIEPEISSFGRDPHEGSPLTPTDHAQYVYHAPKLIFVIQLISIVVIGDRRE
jgi:hypothetical protein